MQTAADSKTPVSNAPAFTPGAPASASSDLNASRQSWMAGGWKTVIVRADGTVERVPSFSELFPEQELPTG